MTYTAQSSAVRHVYFPTDDGEIHALEWGRGNDGPPIVLLHGVTGSAWQWHDVAAALARKRRVIALDLRGHGQSFRSSTQHYSTADHLRDLTAVISQLPNPVDLAGASWGALIAMLSATANPPSVRRLAVVDVEPSFEQDEHSVHARPRLFAHIEDVIAWERRANPAAPDPLLTLWARQSVRHSSTGGWQRQHDEYFFTTWPFRNDDVWSLLPNLDIPTLLVHGKRSFVRDTVMQDMAAKLPNSRLECIEDCGHVVPLEAPDQLANFLTAFFTHAHAPENSTA